MSRRTNTLAARNARQDAAAARSVRLARTCESIARLTAGSVLGYHVVTGAPIYSARVVEAAEARVAAADAADVARRARLAAADDSDPFAENDPWA